MDFHLPHTLSLLEYGLVRVRINRVPGIDERTAGNVTTKSEEKKNG